MHKEQEDNTRILGIDPGFGRVGWGVVEKVSGNLSIVKFTSPSGSN